MASYWSYYYALKKSLIGYMLLAIFPQVYFLVHVNLAFPVGFLTKNLVMILDFKVGTYVDSSSRRPQLVFALILPSLSSSLIYQFLCTLMFKIP